ncbi:CAAX geranylgeranyltransferase alpha subunit [Coemansia sp. RSA 1085]|nr:CAAX geranylgeranyltransferase alpha subunit [Coemansia sp. RSA 1085]
MRIEDGETVVESLSMALQDEWKDVEPIEQDDGKSPMCPIAYTDEYREMMGYLRAVMAVGEISKRALELTGRVIEINPGHYTVWVYRKRLIEELQTAAEEELDWVSSISEKYPKNYQLWHHRESIVVRLWSPQEALQVTEDQRVTNPVVQRELQFLSRAIDEDSKNFHAWSYRQWLVNKYQLWDQEIAFVNTMISQDVRNNSAWNQRYFVVLKGCDPASVQLDDQVVLNEIAFTVENIKFAPNNESPWSYITGMLLRHDKTRLFTELLPRIKALAGDDGYKLAMISTPFYWSALVDIYEQQAKAQPESKEQLLAEARSFCNRLATEVDIMHARYWRYRKSTL